MHSAIPIYWFDTTANPEAVTSDREHETDSNRDNKIRCRSCEHIVTDDGQRISINNTHTHNRINPSGVEYQFQCFRQAPGCASYGTATSEHTWFAGYRWQIVVCNLCGDHLGWFFHGESSFYGLITDRLICDVD